MDSSLVTAVATFPYLGILGQILRYPKPEQYLRYELLLHLARKNIFYNLWSSGALAKKKFGAFLSNSPF